MKINIIIAISLALIGLMGVASYYSGNQHIMENTHRLERSSR
jgi:hypothetical protein